MKSDPLCYAELANDLAKGILHISDYDGALIFPLRIGLYAPVALIIKIFGLSEYSLGAVPFLTSIAGCVLAYVLAQSLFGRPAGLLAASLLAILPQDIAMASTLYPDPIAAFWANLGIGLLILDPEKNNSRRSLSYSALAGICFSIAWTNKEVVAYAAPFVLIVILQRRSLISHIATVGAISLMFLVFEALFYRFTTGDWSFHFHTIPKNYLQSVLSIFRLEARRICTRASAATLFQWPQGRGDRVFPTADFRSSRRHLGRLTQRQKICGTRAMACVAVAPLQFRIFVVAAGV